jgi:hypothetical protein
MRHTRSVVSAGLVTAAWCAGGCRGTPAVPASVGETAQSSDTAFVELGRFEERGTPNGRGGCTWGQTSVPQPGNTRKGVVHEVHSVSVNNQDCVRLNAYGYRGAAAPMDTAGMASSSRTRTLSVDSLRPQPKRP